METVQDIQKMDTGVLKKFAQSARRQLREQVAARLDRVLGSDSIEAREKEAAIKELRQQIANASRESVIDRVAYTWFNRFCALRFMDVNHYTKIGTVSPSEGFSQPEILAEAKQGHIDDSLKGFVNKERVFDLLGGHTPSTDPQQEAYRLLTVGVCNYYNAIMPFLFEKIADYTELLMPDDLLSDSSILSVMRDVLTTSSCRDVEVIGWLYQYYISEKKDEVFEDLKKNKKISPENIPAATQLFTPHWIVRYLVENSLGRLWMLNKPSSRLIDRMSYYVQLESDEIDFLRVDKPEELKICDPACGSGHMLTYAFDLMHAIYEEEGYDSSDIPRLILENNLYGIEIDERAGELAAFALVMKAREKHRRFFNKPVQPNICVLEKIEFQEQELRAYSDAIGTSIFTENLLKTLQQFSAANNFGSLIRPVTTDTYTLQDLPEQQKVASNIFLHATHERIAAVVRYVSFLSPRYHVVVANPPYMGSRGMNPELKRFAEKFYPESKSDLFSMFIERGFELTRPLGYNAMVTMESWMFLSSYEELRRRFLAAATINSMVHMPYLGKGGTSMGISFGTSATLFHKTHRHAAKGHFCCIRYFETDDNGVPLSFPVVNDLLATASADDFRKVPGMPIAYWVTDTVRNLFEATPSFDSLAPTRKGMVTGKNELYVREWFEVAGAKCGYDHFNSRTAAKESSKKWFSYLKGGGFRKWYGNKNQVVNWQNDGADLQSGKHPTENRVWATNFNLDYIFQPNVNWGAVTSAEFSARISAGGELFDAGGSACFPATISHLAVLAFLNSKVSRQMLRALNPTLNFQAGNIGNLPLSRSIDTDELRTIVQSLVTLHKDDWDSQETSWDFSSSPLLRADIHSQSLSSTYENFVEASRSNVITAQSLEEKSNRILIQAYGLTEELNEDVPLNSISMLCNPYHRYDESKSQNERDALFRTDTLRDFISYSVGCMFGRYSLDKPGLILANEAEAARDYAKQISNPSFSADEDNVIPILDDDWFPDDITERFRKFVRITFGSAQHQDNLRFIESALGKELRKYFVREFYADHVKRYRKRPIYWLFSSPKGSFNALIYMHRYRPDTVSIVLNDYLREFRNKLAARKKHLEGVTISASVSPGEKTKALKEIESLKKIIEELDTYERDILYPLATEKIRLDLDAGVKTNYLRFGKALKTIPGIESEDD